uniref:LolCTLe n=1 Tax=Bichromomyia olmeca TaxID=715919 RepID=A0A1B1V3F4_9DIPT|nr:LolCTLe [Bichromomyia olmeca]
MAKQLLVGFILSVLTMCVIAQRVNDKFVVKTLPTGKVIYISKTFMSWYGGLDYCNKFGLSLVSLNSQNENKQLSNVLQKVLPRNEVHCWLGGYKFQDENGFNSLRWVNGGRNITFTNWAKSEPSHGNEHCLEMYYRQYRGDVATWNDRYCHDKHPFVCEKRSHGNAKRC